MAPLGDVRKCNKTELLLEKKGNKKVMTIAVMSLMIIHEPYYCTCGEIRGSQEPKIECTVKMRIHGMKPLVIRGTNQI